MKQRDVIALRASEAIHTPKTLARNRYKKPSLASLYDATTWYWDPLPYRFTYGYAHVRLFEALEKEGWFDHAHQPIRVIDCGIGTGLFSEALIRGVPRRFDVMGVDFSINMLTLARRRLTRRGIIPRLELADLRSLPICEGQMDAVIGALMLEHIPDPLVALREMSRVARAGATVVVVTTRPGAPDLLFRVFFRYHHFEPQQVAEWMSQAGLIAISQRPLAGLARLFGCAYVARKP